MVPTINKTQAPLVSVIIPFLNGGDWLIEAVESVIAQTYSNWEIVLIDDGSKPEASAIAREYENKFPEKIIYAEHGGHVNKGVTASRNLGIKISRGEIIALLDSDDCWLPEKLQKQIHILNTNPNVTVVCEASLYWFSWEKPGQKDMLIKVGEQNNKVFIAPQLMYDLYPLGKGAAPCPSGMILKKEVIKRIGGFEETFTGANQVYEDQAFLSKIYLHETVFISDEANNLYRQRSGSLMQSIHEKVRYRKVRAYFLHWLENYLTAKKINDAVINRLLRRAFFEVNQPRLFNLKRKAMRAFSRLSRN